MRVLHATLVAWQEHRVPVIRFECQQPDAFYNVTVHDNMIQASP